MTMMEKTMPHINIECYSSENYNCKIPYYDLAFSSAFDDSIYAEAKNNPLYTLHHEALDNNSTIVQMKLNFFQAQDQINQHVNQIQTASQWQLISMAGSALMYKEMLHYGTSRLQLSASCACDDKNDKVMSFKINLAQLINYADQKTPAGSIDALQHYIADGFAQHRKPKR